MEECADYATHLQCILSHMYLTQRFYHGQRRISQNQKDNLPRAEILSGSTQELSELKANAASERDVKARFAASFTQSRVGKHKTQWSLECTLKDVKHTASFAPQTPRSHLKQNCKKIVEDKKIVAA